MPDEPILIPGKVMLTGEYAVMFGGESLLSPLPLKLKISHSKNEPMVHQSPLINHAIEFTIDQLSDFENKHGRLNPVIDANQFFSTGSNGQLQKLGIGLSSAEAVGIIKARFKRAGLSTSENLRTIADMAFQIHTEVQSGMGSGADIYCCAYGSPIVFKNNNGQIDIDDSSASIDNSFFSTLLWSGQSADTRASLKKFYKWYHNKGIHSEKIIEELIELSRYLITAYDQDDFSQFLFINDKYVELLRAISQQADFPYWLDIHDELNDRAKECGCRAKPTGAGGGDLILILGQSDNLDFDLRSIKIGL